MHERPGSGGRRPARSELPRDALSDVRAVRRGVPRPQHRAVRTMMKITDEEFELGVQMEREVRVRADAVPMRLS